MRFHLSRSIVAVIGAGSLLVACGGDGGDANGGGSSTSIEDFCGRIAALESAAAPDDIGAAVTALEDLVEAAPNDEVREALETLVPVLTRMSEIDETDQDAINELMDLMTDPKVMEASTVLEDFGSEQCGISSGTSGEQAPESNSIASDVVFDSGAIQSLVETEAAEFLNGGSVTSVVVQGDAYRTVVIDTTSPDGAAALPICEVLADYFDTNAPDVDVEISVLTEGLPAVLRLPGGNCEA